VGSYVDHAFSYQIANSQALVMDDKKNIFCELCKRVTRHCKIAVMDLYRDTWKCNECGEYNKPDNDQDRNSK
jgi:hypothetical protein